MADTKKNASGAADPKRKKITIILIVGIVIFLIWQVSDMFGGGGSSSVAPLDQSAPDMASNTSAGNGSQPSQPQLANQPQIARPLPMSQRESELLRLQQQTQTKYVETMNELQMLKLSLQIAETNKGIMAAKLATIKNQKDIVDLLEPPKQAIVVDYSRSFQQQPILSSRPASQPVVQTLPAVVEEAPSPLPVQQMVAQPSEIREEREEPQIPYTVVSVAKIQDRWSAVIGVQGALFSIHIGDIIPADGSKVMKINSRGIVLERKGKERRVSLVPII